MQGEMQGNTWQPVPGYKSDLVPVEIDEDGQKNEREEEKPGWHERHLNHLELLNPSKNRFGWISFKKNPFKRKPNR